MYCTCSGCTLHIVFLWNKNLSGWETLMELGNEPCNTQVWLKGDDAIELVSADGVFLWIESFLHSHRPLTRGSRKGASIKAGSQLHIEGKGRKPRSGDSRPDTQGGLTCIMILYGHSVRKISGGSGGATPRSHKIFAILRLKNGLKLMLKTWKILKPTMPIYTTTFPQDFWEHNFQQGGHGPP